MAVAEERACDAAVDVAQQRSSVRFALDAPAELASRRAVASSECRIAVDSRQKKPAGFTSGAGVFLRLRRSLVMVTGLSKSCALRCSTIPAAWHLFLTRTVRPTFQAKSEQPRI